MKQHDALVPNGEQHATTLPEILFGAVLGKALSVDTKDLAMTPSRALGQANVNVHANVSNGNLFIEGHQVTVDDGGWNLKLGMVFNSQGEPQWRFNLGRRLKVI